MDINGNQCQMKTALHCYESLIYHPQLSKNGIPIGGLWLGEVAF